ncbi:MAG TPA: hypothetical protein VHE79_05985 [Spirochaetia bacterium]
MGRKVMVVSPQQDELKEEQMRPSRVLGYDRDSIGLYALQRGMLEVAESQFSRAVYLNPFEARFKQHLAWALYKLERYAEAKRCIVEALGQSPDDEDSRYILRKVDEKLSTADHTTESNEGSRSAREGT